MQDAVVGMPHERPGGEESPKKQAGLESGKAGIMSVRDLTHEDVVVDFPFQNSELETLEDYDYEIESMPLNDFEMTSEARSTKLGEFYSRLVRPYTPHEPVLEAEELAELDRFADVVEMTRLTSMKVLLDADAVISSSPKFLYTRFVRTWRDKTIDGIGIWWRRRRFVAREFAWLGPECEDLFSPASSSIVKRVLPTLFLKYKQDGFILMTVDVADAFLTVEQREPTIVRGVDENGDEKMYCLGKVLPGQRDGSQLWYESVVDVTWKLVQHVPVCFEPRTQVVLLCYT